MNAPATVPPSGPTGTSLADHETTQPMQTSSHRPAPFALVHQQRMHTHVQARCLWLRSRAGNDAEYKPSEPKQDKCKSITPMYATTGLTANRAAGYATAHHDQKAEPARNAKLSHGQQKQNMSHKQQVNGRQQTGVTNGLPEGSL